LNNRLANRRRAVGKKACTCALLLLALCTHAPYSAAEVSEEIAEEMTILSEEVQVESLKLRIEAFRSRLKEERKKVQDVLNRKFSGERDRLELDYTAEAKRLRVLDQDRRQVLIDKIENFISSYPNSPVISEAILRLAELYYEKAQSDHEIVMEAWEKAMNAAMDDPMADIEAMMVPPRKDYTKPIALYRRFVSQFPNHKLYDTSMYLLGFSLFESGKVDAAREVFLKFAKESTESELLPEVLFRIGESYFDLGENELPQAIEAYEAVLALGNTSFYDKALYKSAWSYYRKNNYPEDIKRFVELIDIADAATGRDKITKSALRNESMLYLAISFTEWTAGSGLESAQAIEAYFKKIGGRSYEREVYVKLGKVTFEQGQHADAIEVYEEINRRFPYNPDAPNIKMKIVEAYDAQKMNVLAFEARGELVMTYNRFSDWAEQNKRNTEAVEAADKMIENLLYQWAIWRHEQAQKIMQAYVASVTHSVVKPKKGARSKPKKGEVTQVESAGPTMVNLEEELIVPENAVFFYEGALEGYRKYLDLYGNSPRSAEINFFYAEVLYMLKRWEDAGDQYRRVTQNVATPNNKYLVDAAWNMILAYSKMLDEYQERKKKDPEGQQQTGVVNFSKIEEEGGFPRAAKMLIEASHYYQQLFPGGKKTPEIIYKSGEIYIEYERYPEARQEYVFLINNFPKYEFAPDAVKMIIFSFVQEERYGELGEWGEELVVKHPEFVSGEIREYLSDILSKAAFKDADQLFANNEYERAAAAYLAVVKRYPKTESEWKAIYNSAVSYYKLKRWDDASAVFERFVKQYPNNDLSPQALFIVAECYEQVLRYEKAAEVYLRLYNEYARFPGEKTQKLVADSLYNAGTILDNLKQYQRAAQVYLTYARRYPDREDAAVQLFFAGLALERIHDYTNAGAFFAEYTSGKYSHKNYMVEAYFRWAQMKEKLGDIAEARRLYRKTIDAYRKLKDKGPEIDPYFAAFSFFWMIEEDFKKYQMLQLELPQSKLERLMNKKAEMLKDLTKRYVSVVAIGDPGMAIGALYKIGMCYQLFAETLYEAPVPPEFDEEMTEIYQFELQDQAFPIEEKAMQGFQKALEEAKAKGVDNEWVDLTKQALDRYNPGAFEVSVRGREKLQMVDNDLYFLYPNTEQLMADSARVRIESAITSPEQRKRRIELFGRITRSTRALLLGGKQLMFSYSQDDGEIVPANPSPNEED
jgi:TolA-binding protein